MSIISGIIAGIKSGILSGINAAWDLLVPTADLDFSEPVIQEFPETAAGFAAAVGDDACTPSYIWNCQELSGNLVDSIASEELVPSGSPLQGQTAVGLGSTLINRNAVEHVSTTSYEVHSSASFMDQTTGSFAIVVCYRSVASGFTVLVGKRVVAEGYGLIITDTGVTSYIRQNGAAEKATTYSNTPHDGSISYACILVNRDTDTLHVITDDGENTTSIAGYGTLTSTQYFALGYQPGWALSAAKVQTIYCAAFEGAAAEALTKTKLDTWWKHASDPTGLLTTSTRESVISVPVAEGYVTHYAPNTIALGWDSGFSGDNKFGLACNSAIENLIGDSEEVDASAVSWATPVNATTALNAMDSPDGFRSTSTITSTAPGGGIWVNSISATSSTEYTLSVWVKRNGVSDVAGTLGLYDDANASYAINEAFLATGTWTLLSFSVTLGAGITTVRSRVYIDSSGVSVATWGWQLNTGNARGFYKRTSGGAASLSASVFQAPFITNTTLGEIEATWVAKGYVHNTGVYNCPGTGNSNRKRIYTNGVGQYVSNIYDSVGATEVLIQRAHGGGTSEYVHRQTWDQSVEGTNLGGYESTSVLNGTTINGEASPWDGTLGGDATTTIDIGSIGAGFHGDILMQRLLSYDGIQEEE